MSKKLIDLRSKQAQAPFRVTNKSATKAEMVIYGGIGPDFWGDGSMISAKQISDELNKLDKTVNEIVVRINSPGGDVFDGISIYNRLKQHKAKVTVYIDGLAASIASIIALAGDEIIIGEGALYMIHLPWTWAIGNRNDLDNTVNRLLDVEEQLISIYQKKTKLDRSEIKKMLEDETWLDSSAAIELGFVDKKSDEEVAIAASSLEARWIMKKPKAFKSETQVIDKAKLELKTKIDSLLARK